jgi:DNA-binding NarL/FixJ family response regulator
MPGMNGYELAKRLVSGQPNLKVLFSSGYSSDSGVIAGKLDPDTFLQKPYALGELATKVRELLDTRLVAASVSLPAATA